MSEYTLNNNGASRNGALLATKEKSLIKEGDKDDIMESIGEMPSWIFRWGTVVLISLIVLIVLGAYLFRYQNIVQAGCTIVVSDGLPIATANINVNTVDEVMTGEVAIIKLSSFPYEEYGTLEGEISDVPKSHQAPFVTVNIVLKNGLTTTNNKNIPTANKLHGTVEIYTKERSMLQRLSEKIKTYF